jgi:hypothetical protein
MELAIIIPGLVCQTSLKKRGRLPKAATLSLRVRGSVAPGVLGDVGLPDDGLPVEFPLVEFLPKKRSPMLIVKINKIAIDKFSLNLVLQDIPKYSQKQFQF